MKERVDDRDVENVEGGGLVGGLLERGRLRILTSWERGARFWGEGRGAEDAMVTCGLGVETGVCET